MWDTEWENLHLFSLNLFNEAECLVCNRVIKKMSNSALKRHYDNCHPEFHSISGSNRTRKIMKLKEDFRIKNLRIQARCASKIPVTITTNNQIKATYAISLALAKQCRPFEDGQFFKDLCLSIMYLFGEAGLQMQNIIEAMHLSSRTIIRRTEDIGLFIQWETKERIKNARFVSVSFDETIDICKTSQMVICIRTVDSSFNSFEEILKVESFTGNVTGEAIYKAFDKNVLSLVEREKLSGICTSGAPVMVGQKHGFIGQLKKAGLNVPTFQSFIDHETFFSKCIGLKEAMEIAVQIVVSLRESRNDITHKKLMVFLKDIDAYYDGLLVNTESRWLNRGRCLMGLLRLREDIENFLQSRACSKDEDILNAIKCPKILYNLSFLVDMTEHINNLNLVLQRKDINIIELLHAINVFLRKLITLRDQISCQNLTSFPKTQEIFTQFPNNELVQLLVEEMNVLLENFHSRFTDFLSLQWIIDIYNSPLTCSIENMPYNVEAELTLMRQDLLIPMEMGINFWKNICPQKYPTIRDSILKLFSMFTSTHICEAALAAMSHIKSKSRNKLTNSHLETLLKTKFYLKEIDIDQLMDFINTNIQT